MAAPGPEAALLNTGAEREARNQNTNELENLATPARHI